MANSDSPEYKAFQAMYATLKGGLEPSAIASTAFSRDLLTTNERAAATNKMSTDGDRMEGLLNAVERRILADSRAFHTFVDVLKDEGAFSSIVEQLNKTCLKMKESRNSQSGASARPEAASTQATAKTPTRRELMRFLYHEVPHLWKDLGNYLEVPTAKLTSIAQLNLNDAPKCLMDMLEVWLARVDPPPTWEEIAEAVEFVGQGRVAKMIRDKHIPGQ